MISTKGNMNAIVLTGSGFDPLPENNIILIGSTPCAVTQATTTQLTCSAGQNPFGTYYFTLNVVNRGLAILNVNPSVTFQLTATSISPTSSSTGGTFLKLEESNLKSQF